MGYALLYLSVLVLIPLAGAACWKTFQLSVGGILAPRHQRPRHGRF